jgi:hypothetical protein
MKYVMHFLEIIFSFGEFRFGWQQIHLVLPLWILNIEMMRKKLSKQWMESKFKNFSKNFFSFYFLDQLIILVWECPLHVNVQSVVVEVDRIVMVVVVIVTHVEIMIHHEIVVVILHDHRICVIGKFVNKIFLKRIFLLFEIEIMIDVDVIHDHVVQFNIINVIIVNDQDHHHQSKILLFFWNKMEGFSII